MILNPTTNFLRRDRVISLIQNSGYRRVLDVGGALGLWAREIASYVVDIQPPTRGEKGEMPQYFNVDISNPLTWINISEEIAANGFFDFVICTQTLEHVPYPELALKFLSLVGKQGFVSVPNKKTELRRGVAFGEEGLGRCGVQGHWRGFLPHRWLCTVREGAMWFWPKLGFLEYLEGIDAWASEDYTDIELSFFWKHDIPCKVITDEYLDHPDPQSACELYRKELRIGI